MKEEMASPDIAAPSRLSLGGPGKLGDGEGGSGFRCELTPNLGAYIDLISFPRPENRLCDHSLPFEALPVRVVKS